MFILNIIVEAKRFYFKRFLIIDSYKSYIIDKFIYKNYFKGIYLVYLLLHFSYIT